MKRNLAILFCCVLLSGCAGVQLVTHTIKVLMPWGGADSKTGRYKVGNPYVINGIKYYPEEDWEYDERGIASWYGGGDDNFHGKKTANEKFIILEI
jgi:rare lipoprotein A